MGSTEKEGILIARGVFKPTVQFRNAPPTPGVDSPPAMGGGGGRGGRGGGGRGGGAEGGGLGGGAPAAPHLDQKAVREALDHYLKPYLRG
jgi:hypothetical protein